MPRKPTNVPPPQPVPTPVASPEEPSKAWPHRLRLAGLHDFEAARSSLKKQPNLLSEIKCLVLFDEALGIPALPSLLAQLKYLDELTISALSHHRILDWVTIPHDAQTALCRLFHYIKAVRFVRIQNLPLELFFHAERVEIVKLVRFTGFKTYDDPNQTDVPPCLTPRGRPAGSFWPLVELYVDGLNPGDFSTLFMGCVGQSTNPVWDLSQLRCFTWKTQTIRSMQPNMVVMNQFFAMIAISLKHLTLAAPLPATGENHLYGLFSSAVWLTECQEQIRLYTRSMCLRSCTLGMACNISPYTGSQDLKPTPLLTFGGTTASPGLSNSSNLSTQ